MRPQSSLQAYTMRLIDETGLQHVCMEAALDLRRARARYAIDNVDWARCVKQLNKDIQTANAFLSDELMVSNISDAAQDRLCPSAAMQASPQVGAFTLCRVAPKRNIEAVPV